MTSLKKIILVCRPKQQVKNFLVLVPIIFSGNLYDLEKIKVASLAFIAFCFASACMYVLNDIVDKDKDKLHIIKKNRPIAKGDISIKTATLLFFILLTLSIIIALNTSYYLLMTLISYLVLIFFYSLFLKKIIIIDIFCISLGFVLRVISGILVIEAVLSPWIIGATLFITLFIASMKRESEYLMSKNNNLELTRTVLKNYNSDYLSLISNNSCTMALITYFIYCIETHDIFFIITILPAMYCIYRFIWVVRFKNSISDDPTDIFFYDKPIMRGVVVYGLLVILLLY